MNRPGAAAEAEYLCRQGKTGIAIIATRMSSRSSSGVFVKFSTRRRVLIHMRKFFPPPACPLVRCVHVTGREPGAPSGPFSPLCLYNPFKAKSSHGKYRLPAHGVNDRIRKKAPLPLTSIAYHLSSPASLSFRAEGSVDMRKTSHEVSVKESRNLPALCCPPTMPLPPFC